MDYELQPPMVTRVITNPLFPRDPSATKDEPLVWVVSKQHPLVPEMKIVRMFALDETAVEIYSSDGKNGMRNTVPMSTVRLIEEAMTLEVFALELERAEDELDDAAAKPDEGPEPGTPTEVETANGQAQA